MKIPHFIVGYFLLKLSLVNNAQCFAASHIHTSSTSPQKHRSTELNGPLSSSGSDEQMRRLSTRAGSTTGAASPLPPTSSDHTAASGGMAPLPKIRSLRERLTFSWAQKLMDVGNKKPLEMSDLWRLSESRRMQNASQVFDGYLSAEIEAQLQRQQQHEGSGAEGEGNAQENKKNILLELWGSPVTRAVFKMYRRPLVLAGVYKFFNTLVQFFPAILVARILRSIEAASKASTAAVTAASAAATTAVTTAATTAGVQGGAVSKMVPELNSFLQQMLVGTASAARAQGVRLSLLLFLALSLKTAIENQYFDSIITVGADIRCTLSAAIYRKSLRLGPANRKTNSLGEVVNYMQIDTTRMEQLVGSIHVVWDGALQVVGYCALLVYFLGPSVFAGIGLLLLIIAFNSYFVLKLSALRAEILKFTDQRVKLTNEILNGIRAIKSYNWEKPFVRTLIDIRQKELQALIRSANARSLLLAALSAAPALVSVVTLSTYAFMGNILDATKVFTALGLFNQLRFPLIFYPIMLNSLAEGKVSLQRLTSFLTQEEIENYVDRDALPSPSATAAREPDVALELRDASFSWSSSPDASDDETSAIGKKIAGGEGKAHFSPQSDKNSEKISRRGALTRINLKVKKGELIAVIGPTGSGKSTLLSALLGELHKEEGSVAMRGKVAYVPQASWIPNDSLRNVILFGNEYKPDVYNSVLKDCGLSRDLELLEAGDDTEIGERGINLSGGQKQRVSIARAVYEDADLYLFDDPLSALDAEVGARLFDDCVYQRLSGKTRILVIHQLSVLPKVDRIVIMSQSMGSSGDGGSSSKEGEGTEGVEEEGSCRILDQGTLEELQLRGHDLRQFVTVREEIGEGSAVGRPRRKEVEAEKQIETEIEKSREAGELELTEGDGTDEDGEGAKGFSMGEGAHKWPELELKTEEDQAAADTDGLAAHANHQKEEEGNIETSRTSQRGRGERREEESWSPDVAGKCVGSAGEKVEKVEGRKGSRAEVELSSHLTNTTSLDNSLPSSTPTFSLSSSSSSSSSSSTTSEDARICIENMAPTGAMVDCCGSECIGVPSDGDDDDGIVGDEKSRGEREETTTIAAADTLRSEAVSSRAQAFDPGHAAAKKVLEEQSPSAERLEEQSSPAGISWATGSSLDSPPVPSDSGFDPAVNLRRTAAPVKLISAEERAEGAVSVRVYKTYLNAANRPFLLLALIASYICANSAQLLQQGVVAAWTSDVGYARRPLSIYLAGVSSMAGLAAVFAWLRTYLQAAFGAAASRTLHANMVTRVLNAPLSFFESTPVGRLVQRFSKDLDQIDQQLPQSVGSVITSALQIAGSMCAICLVTPSFGLVMVALFAVYFSVTGYFRNVARELKRLDSISRSPIFAHFGESLSGLPVIRCFGRQAQYRSSNELKLDDNLSAYYAMKVVDRWLSVRLEILGNIIVLCASLLAVVTGTRAGTAGLSLSNALGITSLLNWAVRNGLETEALMTGVERVLYTSTETPQERSQVMQKIDTAAAFLFPEAVAEVVQRDNLSLKRNEEHNTHMNNKIAFIHTAASAAAGGGAVGDDAAGRTAAKTVFHEGSSTTMTNEELEAEKERATVLFALPKSDEELLKSGWPWAGAIRVQGAVMRYREDFEPVLRGVDFEVRPGERLGIVGRTGSGKSTLFRALLRLTELQSGRVSLDGVDIAHVGLDVLRSSISIIPQDPVLFSGSVRKNLDPFDAHSDAELWAALRKSNLERTVRALPGGLQFEVVEGGENFSSGQRQLLCLARALVRRSKILLLDEATSSVDFETDGIIQKTIREQFGSGTGAGAAAAMTEEFPTTVLTIAHRLDTILDSDRVLVMDAGRIAELDTPERLLKRPNSLFSQLVAADSVQKLGVE